MQQPFRAFPTTMGEWHQEQIISSDLSDTVQNMFVVIVIDDGM